MMSSVIVKPEDLRLSAIPFMGGILEKQTCSKLTGSRQMINLRDRSQNRGFSVAGNRKAALDGPKKIRRRSQKASDYVEHRDDQLDQTD
jgi:hypothetical protein